MRLQEGVRAADEDLTALAEGADVVRRLAFASGLTCDQANDVCFVTLQHLFTAPRGVSGSPTQRLLRTAMEQCAVARCLAWRESPARVRRHGSPAVSA